MLDPVNFTGEGEELFGYAPETRLIPPAEIPNQAAKAPSKRIEPATRKLQRPQTVVLPPKKPPISRFPKTATPRETEGQSAWPHSMRSRTTNPEASPSFDERFCAECSGHRPPRWPACLRRTCDGGSSSHGRSGPASRRSASMPPGRGTYRPVQRSSPRSGRRPRWWFPLMGRYSV